MKLSLWLSLLGVMLLGQVALTAGHAAPPRQQPDRPPAGSLTGEWAVQLAPGANPDAVAAQYSFENLGQIGALANFYLFRRPAGQVGAADIQGLETEVQVLWSEQQVARQRQPRILPSDPLYGSQWHLHNTGQSGGTPGQDVNVVPVWNSDITGSGVVVAVVDDGLQHSHPDFQSKYLAAASYDFNGDDNDPAPQPGSLDSHGTAVAGVAAAGNEGTCGVGAAFGAQVSGLRLIALPTTDAEEASALTYQLQLNDIYNSSWGPSDNGQTLEAPGPLTQAALQQGVATGRGGLGAIYVWAGGNGLANNDNGNYDGFANSRFTIAVGAVDHQGFQSYYSEPGAAMLVTAPSSGSTQGVTTSDLLGGSGYSSTNCTNNFGGTSSSAPLVSGVIALVLEARPGLSWRDVQHILVRTAVQNDPADSDWKTNGAGYLINHKYGFGRVDANAAVSAATSWTPVGPAFASDSGRLTVNQAIPDNTPTGVTTTFTVTEDIKLEHVEVVFEAEHTFRGDLNVILTSPSGTQSILAETHNDPGDDYPAWRFMTVRHWDEAAQGVWTLQVIDQDAPFKGSLDTGVFNAWRLVLHGTNSSLTFQRTYLPFLRKDLPSAIGPITGGFTNGDFEAGKQDWTEFSQGNFPLILPESLLPSGVNAHSGSWAAWLGGAPNEIAAIQQEVTIPTDRPYLSYWRWIASQDNCGNDFGQVLIDGALVNSYDLCNLTSTSGWEQHILNLSAYAGQTVILQFRAETNGSGNSNLFIDTASFQATATAATPFLELEASPDASGALKPPP